VKGVSEEKNKDKYCTCNKWKAGTDHINSFIFLGKTHGKMFNEKFKFDYCPWCGRKLKGEGEGGE
jgi:hypothetical protein